MQTVKKAYCLKCRPECRKEYVEYHKDVWPAVEAALRRGGAVEYELFITPDNLLFAYVTFRKEGSMDKIMEESAKEPDCAQWDKLMAGFQERCDFAAPGEWWSEVPCIYSLNRE